MLVLVEEGNGWRMMMAGPNRELEPVNLRLLKSEVAAAWADVFHALRGFYELADILIVLDEVHCLKVSNFARQLKFNPEVGDDHPVALARRGDQTTREKMWRQRKTNGIDGILSNTRERKMDGCS